VNDTVHDVRLAGADFVAAASHSVRARSVFIATGVVDTLPESQDVARMIEAGTLRLCPICDAYEVINKRVAVIGPVDDALKKALFLRTFSDHITVLATDDAAAVDPNGRKELTKAGSTLKHAYPAQSGLPTIKQVLGSPTVERSRSIPSIPRWAAPCVQCWQSSWGPNAMN
jgi:thioredoxin reductase (NADPH)